jgi:hypothetical protein
VSDGATEIVICQLWPLHDPRFSDRHYTAWWGNCAECSTKLVVTNQTHMRLATEKLTLLCEQCSEKKMTAATD